MGKFKKKKKQWNQSSTDLNYKIIGNSSGHWSNTRWSRGPCQEEKQQNWSLNEKKKTFFLCIYLFSAHTYVCSMCTYTDVVCPGVCMPRDQCQMSSSPDDDFFSESLTNLEFAALAD